jgi:hypothetical protein
MASLLEHKIIPELKKRDLIDWEYQKETQLQSVVHLA